MGQCYIGPMRKTFLTYYLPVLLYAALIFWGSSLHKIPQTFPFAWKDKLLHAGEYCVMGILLARSTIAFWGRLNSGKVIVWTGIIGGVYAASDEFHQYFVPGRSCDFYDWLADIAGLACGATIIYIIAMRKRANGWIK
jgi:VanZ family protein